MLIEQLLNLNGPGLVCLTKGQRIILTSEHA